MKKSLKIGIVIVSYGHEDILPDLIDRLSRQLKPGDQIAVVDNHANGKGSDSVADNKYVSFAVKAQNKGFSSGCNIGADKLKKSVDVLFFLNPDTTPSQDTLDTIREANYIHYGAVMPLLTLPDGTVNSAGNIVHTSGLSWCDGYGNMTSKYSSVQDVSVLSGACAAISVEWWEKLGGMSELYFMYYEDTDLSARIQLMGGKMGLLSSATIEHDYDYEKGNHKWLYLERNRPLYIIRTWPTSVIAVLFVQLIFIEIGLLGVALIQGRIQSKLRAYAMTIKALPVAMAERKTIQKQKQISGYDFLCSLTYKIDTPMLPSLAKNNFVDIIFKTYYRVSLWVLKTLSM